jgi:hypothetical protein
MDLINVFCDGAMRALALHIADRGLTLSEPELDRALAALRTTILTEYQEMLPVAKGALGMGEAMLRTLLNTYCNAAAVGALKAAGLHQPRPWEGRN